MQSIPDANVPRKNGRIFYFAAIFLLLGAVGVTIIQKGYESTAAITAAKGAETEINVQQIIQYAAYWQIVGLATITLAAAACCIAHLRHEEHRWVWGPIIVLFVLYFLLQLIMV